MKRRDIFVIAMLIAISQAAFAQSSRVTIEITGVKINEGNVHIDIFNEPGFKKSVSLMTFALESQNSVLAHEFELPNGEYVFAVYQDTNNNGELDTNFFGIPKEPYGFSNYPGGLSISFNKLKVMVNGGEIKVTVNIGGK
jgi:uncharacterized protein (DUF2141 family)